MSKRKKRPLYQRIAIDVAGFGLMILAVLTGWLPGPGGIPLFLVGLGVLSLNYEWAERLLKNFEKKRKELTDRYLMTSPKVSITIDLLCLAIIAVGIYGIVHSQALWARGLNIGGALLGLVVLLSNQKRFERLAARIKSKK